MDLPELEIGGILLAPIIAALIEAAKALGMDVKYAPWANGVLSLIGYGAVVYVGLVPGSLEVTVYVLNALIIFLTAAGFYDRGKALLGWLLRHARPEHREK